MPNAEHEPVLVQAVLRELSPRPGMVVVDGTVGLGGHAAAIIPLISPGGTYVGLDVDAEMLASARERLKDWKDCRVELVHASYAEFREVVRTIGSQRVDAVLLDLGANSAQLDDPARGFSFTRDGPLDMRFDRSQKRTAADLVNSLPETELADMIYELGQDHASRRIARKICQVRHKARITTTLALARAVESSLAGISGGGGKIHPATRVFQALRIAVNLELDNLERFLAVAAESLNVGGKLMIISFHSLEDAIVKKFLRSPAGASLSESTKRPIVADDDERKRNPRSRSAKMRVCVKEHD
ncbi:MAG: 16S rRNA (cytosine(1402)-N(4))-methyltransferase RsmH [Phycisphaerae bacterium]|nr:16S rRNA (cytosine(1402)-N(4))-methyltransferase RsmH [Phycisphaerae bacterium]